VEAREGDSVEVDLSAGAVKVGERFYQGTKLPTFLREILADGGLVAHRRKQRGLV
jgi:methanogen homoaconitase small subunit